MSQTPRNPCIERRAAMRQEQVRHSLARLARQGETMTLPEQLSGHDESFRQGVSAALYAMAVDLTEIRKGEMVCPEPQPSNLKLVKPFPFEGTEYSFTNWPTSHSTEPLKG